MLPPDPPAGEPTQSLSRAFAIAARVSALPPHLHAAAILTACGSDQELQRQVQAVLRSPVTATNATKATELSHEETFGRYVLHEMVGQGSMGVVYRATQTDTRRIVALKRLRPGEASDAVLNRFRREVVLLARLNHHGIVQILDAGHVTTPTGREPYLAMEFVDGPPLLAGAEQWQLDQHARVRLLVQICRAIGHAHRRGVIHRDIKPDNVRLEVEGDTLLPRVLDFGVATAAVSNSSEATLAQHVVGTLGHIAPEQIDGEVDVRCDVYSLGVLGYQLLTGRQPIEVRGLGVLSAIARIRDAEPVPAGNFDPRMRGDLEVVLARAIARRVDDRYGAADDFADDLVRWLQDRPVEAQRPTPWYLLTRFVRRQRKLSAAVAAVLLVLGISTYGTLASFSEAAATQNSLVTVLTSTVSQLSARINGSPTANTLSAELRAAVDDMVIRFPEDLGVRRTQAEVLQIDGQVARSRGQSQRAVELRNLLLEVRSLIEKRDPSPEAKRNLALAHVLVGDLHKEIALAHNQSLDRARSSYAAAHPLYLALHAEALKARQPQDDLAHNFMRLAALDIFENKLDAAEDQLQEARKLIENLTADYSDSPYTFGLLRELAGLSGSLAERRGNHPAAMAMMDKMLESIQVVHRMDPDNLFYTEYLLATTHACAAAAFEGAQFEKARVLLRQADPLVQTLAARAPDNLHATEQRMMVAVLWARLALHGNDFVGALHHLTTATDLVLRLGGADDLTSMLDLCRKLAGQVWATLIRLDARDEPHGEGELAACRLLYQSFLGITSRFPEDHPLRITHSLIQVTYCNRDELGAIRNNLATAQREGWYDPSCWFVEMRLLERNGDVAGARALLAVAPDNLSADLRAAAERRAKRWNGK